MEQRVEGEWAFKGGKRWFRGTSHVGDRTQEIGFVYDGRRSFVMQRSGRGGARRTSSNMLPVEHPMEPGPLDFGWFLNRRPASEVLREGGFRVVGREESPKHVPLMRVVGREWAAHPAPTTMWIAERKGCLPVRVERRMAEGQEPYEIMETTAVQRVGPVWLAVAARSETRVPGGNSITMIVATNARVNSVRDSLFVPKWTDQGEVWDSATHTPLRIEPSGRLGLDPRFPRVIGWSDGRVLTRLVVAVAVFAALVFLTIAAVHGLRKTSRLRDAVAGGARFL